MGFNMGVVKVEGTTKEDLFVALRNIGEMDADFSGENGLDYLWLIVWKANGFESRADFEAKECSSDSEPEGTTTLKYESNLEWVLDQIKDLDSDKEIIEAFVSRWLDKDYYYSDYQLEVIYNEDEKAEFIALTTIF